MHSYMIRSVRLAAVPLLLVGVMAGISPVTAATARTGSGGPAASSSINGGLGSVAATSASSAWAVGGTGGFGYFRTGRAASQPTTIILHWNGTTWQRMPVLRYGGFTGVAATSASNAVERPRLDAGARR